MVYSSSSTKKIGASGFQETRHYLLYGKGIKSDDLLTVAGFLLPRDDRVRFPDSAAFVARSFQTFVGDLSPELFQSQGCRLVRVPFCIIRGPRHFIQAPFDPKSR